MSSVKRSIAQRNNNVTQIVPAIVTVVNTNTPLGDISGASIYRLSLPNVQNVGGIYYVDLSGVDLSGNLLNIAGTFNDKANLIMFSVDVPFPASYTPGLEFTLFFKNPPFQRVYDQGLGPIPLLTLGIVREGIPIPYIVSPPVPWLISENISLDQSLTFKSDGSNYNVVASGPAGWYGTVVLAYLLNAYGPP